MLLGNRKTIGVLFGGYDASFSVVMLKAMRENIARMDVDVIFFSTVSYFQYQNQYDKMENRLFDFAPLEGLDGVLYIPDTYYTRGFTDTLTDMLKKRTNCPIVTLRNQDGPGSRIYTAEKEAIRPLVRHLIEDHNLTRIGFVSGYVEHLDSQTRLECFIDEMKIHGLEVPTEAIYHGDMWLTTGPGAYRYYYEETNQNLQAIVCANDYMAKGLTDELRRHGFRVPEDVIITGFDNASDLGSAITFTTIEQDYGEIIRQGIDILWEQMNQSQDDWISRDVPIGGKLILGRSCGCVKNDRENLEEKIAEIGRQRDQEGLQTINLIYLTAELSSCNELSDLHPIIAHHSESVLDQRDYYICLFQKEEDGKPVYADEITDRACLISAIRDRHDEGIPMISFESRKLLPDTYLDQDEPRIFFLSILHQGENVYGFTMLRLTEDAEANAFFQHRNVLIAGAVRNIYSQMRLKTLYEEQTVISRFDPLTKVLNRRGLEEEVNSRWEALCEQKATVGLISIDMDKLKLMNDHYGHFMGDQALTIISRAILASFGTDALAARMGGDEFFVFLPECSEGEAREQVRGFRENLSQLSRTTKMPGEVRCSIGLSVIQLEPGAELEKCILLSDAYMYKEKKKHHEAEN